MTRIVLTMALEPALDRSISPGAYRCLVLLRSLAGRARQVRTLTCALGRQLGRCTNTIRTYRDQLVGAGYVWWATDRRSGVTTVVIRSAVEVGPATGQGRGVWPREPQPAPWHGRGAQFLMHIKQNQSLRRVLDKRRPGAVVPQPPRFTVEEQLAIVLSWSAVK